MSTANTNCMNGYSEDYSGSYVDHFRINGRVYEHTIHCNTDDRVECTDDVGNVVLTFTADCYVYVGTRNGSQLGHFTMSRDDCWLFRYGAEGKELNSHSRDLLKFEVEVSKMYLKGEL